ncbi:MAG: FMN-binding protein [Christensenellales bacterium]|nr:FMN-binding protein [Christensenellales bacterium]
MKKMLAMMLALTLVFGAAALAEEKTFSAEYEMKGTTSAGKPKNDTFVFEGKTVDGVITELNFDIIRNKGTEGEYSKKGIMGYMMNVSDAAVEKTEDGYALSQLAVYGYDPVYDSGTYAQFMLSASAEKLTDELTFGELTFSDMARPDHPVSVEKAVIAYQYLASEAGMTLTAETPVKDLLAIHGFYQDGAFVEGTGRVSFAGYHGGRSYGEQIDAIAAYILEQGMTLEEVYEMFKTVNQASQPIEERDTISGATITFVGDFQRMVYMAMYGELFEGVVNHTTTDGVTKVEVATQGFGGEIETQVSFDADGKMVDIKVRDAQETEGIGAALYAEDAAFLQAMIEGNTADVDNVSGATVTSEALKKAVKMAQEYVTAL